MRSSENLDEDLVFAWDPQAFRSYPTHKLAGDEKRDLAWYLDWLEEIKPERKELYQTKLFEKPFTLT
jgi:hypothetical protein